MIDWARIGAVSLIAISGASAQGAGIGAIRGTAVDLSGAIIPGVGITILDLNRATETTHAGWYVFDSVSAGAHQVRARRVGFASVVVNLQVIANDVTFADFVMKPLATELAPITVRTARDTRGAPLEFSQRIESGQGTYFTAGDIEKAHPRRVSDMLRRVSGLDIRPNGDVFSGRGSSSINSEPCVHGMPIYVDRVLIGGGSVGDPTSLTGDTLHRTAEWLSPTAGSRSVIDGMKPQDIVGIEIYKGPATAPATIPGATSSCGVILIWTK